MICQGGRENAHFYRRRITTICSWPMQVPLRCFEGQKLPLEMELAAPLEVLLLTKTMTVAKQPRCSCHGVKMYQNL